MRYIWYFFSFVTVLLLVSSCAVSTKAKREADLQSSRSAGRIEGFIAGCTFAANGVAGQLGLSIDPATLTKICTENASK